MEWYLVLIMTPFTIFVDGYALFCTLCCHNAC
jgi:hypothetical protein